MTILSGTITEGETLLATPPELRTLSRLLRLLPDISPEGGVESESSPPVKYDSLSKLRNNLSTNVGVSKERACHKVNVVGVTF